MLPWGKGMRIVSLLPSATEILFALGLGDQVVGVSHECDYPPEAKGKPVVVRCVFDPSGMTPGEIDATVRSLVTAGRPIYRLERAVLEEVRPDLVVTQALCEVCAISESVVYREIGALRPPPRLLSLHPHSLEEVLRDILRVGEATSTLPQAARLVEALRRRIHRVVEAARGVPVRPRVVCLEWLDPLMVGGHWVPEMVSLAGGEDVLGRADHPSFTVTWEQVVEARPEVLLLMPCGYTAPEAARQARLLARLPGWTSLPAVQRGRVFACDGHNIFSRPGPRLVEGLGTLAALLHPHRFPSPPRPEQAIPLLTPEAV
jgi:iron complex transport system substrate-binding protein